MRRTAATYCFSFVSCRRGSPARAHPTSSSASLKVPVKFDDMYRKVIEREITVTRVRAVRARALSAAVLSHGRRARLMRDGKSCGRARYSEAAKYFASLGYSVWVPTRVGYGVSGTDEDPEDSGACGSKLYPPAYAAAAEQVLQVMAYAKRLRRDRRHANRFGRPIVRRCDQHRARLPQPRRAASLPSISPAVGGGDPQTRPGEPCEPFGLARDVRRLRQERPHPDALDLRRERPLLRSAAREKLVRRIPLAGRPRGADLLPPFGDDGHLLFTRGLPLWQPIVERFLARIRSDTREAQ